MTPDLVPEDLPDLETRVGLAGAPHQAEVGGAVCFNDVVVIAIASGG